MAQIGRFQIERELGRGGMGVVYAAHDPELGRRVALKLILHGAADLEALARFGREALALAKVRHPGVLQVFEVGRASQGPFVVTALVEGETLTARLARGPLPAREAATIVAALADAVAALHAAGLLHRDIKPGNVMLRADGTPVLLDFGLVRDESAEQLTRTGELLGTPAYMSPEQANGDHGRMGAPADVWSLGATLFALLTGRPPFDGQTVIELLHKLMFEEPDWPTLARVAPPELVAVVRRALAKAPRARYDTAAALRLDLELWLAGKRPLAARAERSRRWRVAAAAGLGVATAALLAAAALSRAPTPASPVAPAPRDPTPNADAPAPHPQGDPWLALDADAFLAELPFESAVASQRARSETIARCRAWLTAHPEHPAGGPVRARLLAALLGAEPLGRASLDATNAAVTALDAERVLVLAPNEPELRWWRIDPAPAAELGPPWPLGGLARIGSVLARSPGASDLLAVGYDPTGAPTAAVFRPTASGGELVATRALAELAGFAEVSARPDPTHGGHRMRLASSADGARFAVGTAAGELAVYAWDDLLAPSAAPLLPRALLREPGRARAHAVAVRTLAFGADGACLFSGAGALGGNEQLGSSSAPVLRAWDLRRDPPACAGEAGGGGDMAIACPDRTGSTVVFGINGEFVLTRVSASGERLQTFVSPGVVSAQGRQGSHRSNLAGAWFLARGSFLLGAAGTYVPRDDRPPAAELRAWDAASGAPITGAELRHPPEPAFQEGGALTPDGRRLITVASRGRGASRILEVWDVDLGVPP